MDKNELKRLAGVLTESKNVEVNTATLDRIIEALEAGIYAIRNPDSNQQFAVNAMHDVLQLIDKLHQYKSGI